MDVEKTIEFLLEHQAAHQARFEANSAEFWAGIKSLKDADERLGRRLDRAVRLSALEHRRERARRKKLEAKTAAGHARLDASMAELAQSLKRFLDSRKNGLNRHDEA